MSATAEPAGANADRALAGPVCFVQPSHYEILVGGRKLIGSAQLRRKGVMLQHGAIPICGDVARVCDGLRFESEAARDEQRARTRQRAVTLSQALGRSPAWEEVADALEAGFAHALELDRQPGALSADEEAEAAALVRTKFGDPAWTGKR